MVGKPNKPILPAPLHPIPITSEPFRKIVIDCVGPLPRTKKGNQYLLTVMDTATRYPEVYPLKTISSKNIIRCLTNLFTHFGFSEDIQSDCGSNFTSNLFKEVLTFFNISHDFSSAYHPQSQGSLERFHQTFKTMLRKYCLETQTDWDENIGMLLFAVRECPQESLGYSPFQLLYGRQIRGPLKQLKDKLLTPDSSPKQTVSQYLNHLKVTLARVRKLALENFARSQKKMKTLYDLKSQVRKFNPGDKVLLFLPVHGQPLRSKYSGPYVVSHSLNKCNYVVHTPDRRKDTQLVHLNLMKPYIDREEQEHKPPLKPVGTFNSDVSPGSHDNFEVEIPSPLSSNQDILENISDYVSHLPLSKRNDLVSIFKQFPRVTEDVPGYCDHTLHNIELINPEVRPIKQQPYRLNPERYAAMKEEVDYLIRHGLAEPSNSPWASPCLLVPKPNGAFRLCTDYRKVNKVTVPDSYPLPLIDVLIDNVGKSEFLTKIDLQKGYYQIGLTEKAKAISAFITPFGLFQYNVMPFGLCNAPATFQRSLNYTIQGLEGVSSYLDDLLVMSTTWDVHRDFLTFFQD